MVDIVAGLAAIGQAIAIAKDLNQIKGEYDQAGLRLKIAELTSALADAKVTMAEAQEALLSKDAEIHRLANAFRERAELVESRGYMYRKRADGKPEGRPYCPRCIQEGKLYMTVVAVSKGGRCMACPECRREYLYADEYLFERD